MGSLFGWGFLESESLSHPIFTLPAMRCNTPFSGAAGSRSKERGWPKCVRNAFHSKKGEEAIGKFSAENQRLPIPVPKRAC